MLYREIITGFSDIPTRHTNTMCEQYLEFFNVKPSDI